VVPLRPSLLGVRAMHAIKRPGTACNSPGSHLRQPGQLMGSRQWGRCRRERPCSQGLPRLTPHAAKFRRLSVPRSPGVWLVLFLSTPALIARSPKDTRAMTARVFFIF
jgi:hypothetical protein